MTKLDEENVELYVMKAFAKELVKGKIDNVGQKVFMTWVQPRVLAKDQVHFICIFFKLKCFVK